MAITEDEPADRRPIARLRRVAEALARLGSPHPADAAWFIAAVERYHAACRAGFTVDLGSALGLSRAGRDAWWTDELRLRRDETLRELYSRYFSDLSPGRAASQIMRLARLVQQNGTKAVPGDDRFALISEALLTGQTIPGRKQITRILGHRTP